MEWISVKDRLPEKGEKVLVSMYRSYNILMGRLYENGWAIFFSDGEKLDETGFVEANLTHWMPLPEQPK